MKAFFDAQCMSIYEGLSVGPWARNVFVFGPAKMVEKDGNAMPYHIKKQDQI